MPILTKFRLDRSRLAAPQVFESLREAILTLELVPGAMLVRSELAGQFGVSQTPIREALLRLEEEGLVDVFPQHATLVSRIDVAAAREAHFLRRSIELEIVRTLALQPPPAWWCNCRRSAHCRNRWRRRSAMTTFWERTMAFTA